VTICRASASGMAVEPYRIQMACQSREDFGVAAEQHCLESLGMFAGLLVLPDEQAEYFFLGCRVGA
jgi:hypothetical protein